MRFLIHACPQRMWYVEGYLVPSLLAQGADPESVEIWNDAKGLGNLRSCMASFAARTGDGGTWHIQDDVLLCRDFVKRCGELDQGVVYGFCSPHFRDEPDLSGTVYLPDAWHSFQCIRIPDPLARECAEWFSTDAPTDPELRDIISIGLFDDFFFSVFMDRRHPQTTVTNAKPCLVEHVDRLIGGSVINEWRGHWVRAHWFADPDLTDKLAAEMEKRETRCHHGAHRKD